MSKKILITGGAGFIGSSVAKKMIELGHRVWVVDNLSTGLKRNIPPNSKFLKLDISSEKDISKLPKDMDVILHFAGQSSGEISYYKPLLDLRSNTLGTLLLLRYAKKNNIKRFIFSSSMSVYGDPNYLPADEGHPTNPLSFYGASKLAAEKYISIFNREGIDTTIFRLFSVYGPFQNMENLQQGIVSIYMAFLLDEKPVIVKGAKERFRDLIYIDDVVNAYEIALDNKKSYGKIYNVGTGIKTTVEELLNAEIEAFHFDKNKYPIVFEGSTPCDTFGISANIDKIKAELGWKPKNTLQEGLKKMVDWLKKNN